jgi:hypothetical protein
VVLEESWERCHAQVVAFIGVDFKDTEQDATAFLWRYGLTYPSGPTSRVMPRFCRDYWHSGDLLHRPALCDSLQDQWRDLGSIPRRAHLGDFKVRREGRHMRTNDAEALAISPLEGRQALR